MVKVPGIQRFHSQEVHDSGNQTTVMVYRDNGIDDSTGPTCFRSVAPGRWLWRSSKPYLNLAPWVIFSKARLRSNRCLGSKLLE